MLKQDALEYFQDKNLALVRVFNQHVKWTAVALLKRQPPLVVDSHMPGSVVLLPVSNNARVSTLWTAAIFTKIPPLILSSVRAGCQFCKPSALRTVWRSNWKLGSSGCALVSSLNCDLE